MTQIDDKSSLTNWPKFLGQNDLIFLLRALREKKKNHFDLKNWITGGTKIWPKFLGQNDSIFSLSFTERKNESFWPKKFNHWQNKNLTQIFKSKWLNFFASCTERKISHFDLKKIETLAELKFDPNFWVKMTQFFAHCTERKNESFWPKKLSYWRKKSWPKFLGQNDSFFLSVHREKRLSHFDLKIWVTGNDNSTNFHNRFYLVK